MPTFQQYATNLKTFYQRVIKDHSNMIKLSRNFTQMIQDLSKNQNTLVISRLSKRKSQLSISGLSIASNSKSVKSLRSLTNIKSNKGQSIYDNNDFKKVILFAYLHHVITISNTDIFNMIETKSKLLIDAIEQNKISDKIKWDRCIKEWKKVMQLMTHKTKVRWQKILANSITSFQDDFIDVILRSVMHTSSNIQNLFSNPIENLQQISNQLKICLCYFQFSKGEIIKKKDIGQFKYNLKIGYIKADGCYAFYQKLPTEKIQSSQTKIQQKAQKNQKNERSQRNSKNQPSDNKHFLTIDTKTMRNMGIDINKSTPSPIKRDDDTRSRKSHDANNDDKSQKSISQTSKKRPGLPSNLVKKKNLRVIEALLRQYNANTVKFTDLECFISQESKDAKIKKMLQSRKKIQLQ